MIKLVYLVFPVLILYQNKWIPSPHAGVSYGPLVVIRPSYKHDKGLLEHELFHSKQAYKLLLLPYMLLYKFSECFRLKQEVEAYRVQLRFSPGNVVLFSRFIATRYNILRITSVSALKLLSGERSEIC